MKANAPKRKVFDAVDVLVGEEEVRNNNDIRELSIESIKPFHNHPFRLYEGERLEDMVESIKEHGVLNPVIVLKTGDGYEMLSGHNRQNAARIAGLKTVPAIVKAELTEEEAYVYVIETNLMQRSFTDMEISEKAAVLQERYDKVMSQGKRNDILREIAKLEGKESTSGHRDQKLWSRDAVGAEYGLSGSSVARLLRVNHLIEPLKDKVDKGSLGMKIAIQLSYLTKEEQEMIHDAMKEMHVKLSQHQVIKLREHAGELTPGRVRQYIKMADPNKKLPVVKVPARLIQQYFAKMEPDRVDQILEEAIREYFEKREG
ncbi:ParB N-terminal domain-containing protein [Blautia hansenii]|uniref:ParB-like protein n=1 Tax=Blautia hansenii DSM 20583 TaxID=537007 RepID=C9LAY8_BLAHA|nr:ParB N-terminal domain-containing protein [Blautia hansenii]ASM69094.1 chromosome partitioning protein ParB [Blautia hansenii DSM 20583]EEX20623.1 ParB-like protein [Blautia hansenii DSM 20583]UWO11682.1 ParB N-terminal domain-containing protein [Blautia hansenii DSM 20583]